MNDSDLKFDRSCHALYTKQCKQQILEKIALHYPEKQRAGMWDSVQRGEKRWIFPYQENAAEILDKFCPGASKNPQMKLVGGLTLPQRQGRHV